MSQSPKTITVNLGEPVVIEKGAGKEAETITSLTFRRRKAKDLVAMDAVKGENRKFMAMLASMSGTTLPVIEELDADDFEAVSREVLPLLGNSVARAAARAQEDLTEDPEPSGE